LDYVSLDGEHFHDNLKKFSDFKYALLAVVIVLTLIMYILTCLSLKKQAKSVGNKDDRQAHKFLVASEERFLRTVIIIAAIYLYKKVDVSRLVT
jgi:Mn2+/Fe2+ NRAMP family transporter